MAGGSGTRLWPLSRAAYPKQFLALNSHLSLLQETAQRLSGLPVEKPIVICNEEHRFLVAEQLRQQQLDVDILLEPVGRNTAPAIALAALHAIQHSCESSPVLLVLATDHTILDDAAFRQAVCRLLPQVEEGCFGVLGVRPTEPTSAYGYIHTGDVLSHDLRQVRAFVEKPDAATAQEYLDQGDYLWNSGIFMLRADQYLEELRKYQPEILSACQKAMESVTVDQDFTRIDAQAFMDCPENSIDYALMEPLCAQANNKVVVAELDAGWSDVGSWSALWEIKDKDEHGNVVMVRDDLTTEDVVLQDSQNNLVCAHSKLVTLLGVENLVVVDTDDALLIANKSDAQEIKQIVSILKGKGRHEYQSHRVVYRPWGKYDSIDAGHRYQVKRITVKPGARLSLQMHHHRSEHWIVVLGTAKVTIGDKTFLMTEDQSTYIPVGEIHSLENPGAIPLEMIEVQSGAYLGEDDIVRFEDLYGRS